MKPMLACQCADVDLLRFPVLATPKLDGIRCVTLAPEVFTRKEQRCTAMSRNLKYIPNHYIRGLLELDLPPGCDGELMAGNFQSTSSGVMSNGGRPDFRYYIFDFNGDWSRTDVPYHARLDVLTKLHLPDYCVKVLPQIIDDVVGLNSFEVACLQQGYEGVMTRPANSPYKYGRSTWREQWLVKIKRFADSEAEVLEVVELQHNGNAPEQDALGHQVRSTDAAGMTPGNIMGSLRCRDLRTKIEFSVGTGFDDLQRTSIWTFRSTYVGSILKYKYQPHGVKEAPRFPVFLGWRDPNDL